MAISTDVTRSLDAIDAHLQKLKSQAKQAKDNVKALGKELQLDPTNIDLITKRFEQQRVILSTYQERMGVLQDKLKVLDEEYKSGNTTLVQYQKKVNSVNEEMNRLNNTIEEQTKLTQDNVLKQEIQNAQYTEQQKNLDKVTKATDGLAKAVKYLTALYTVAITKSIQYGAELYDISKKYGTTAEELQKQRFLFEELAQDSSGYEKALQSLAGTLRTLNRGTGDVNAIAGALRKIGLSVNDIKGETATNAYNKIFEALRNVTDETERANAALLIFGDNGLNVANVASATAQQIDTLNNALSNAGLITNDQASKLKELELQYNLVKQSLSSATAELTVAFAPTLIWIAGILKDLANFLSSDFGKGLLFVTTLVTLFGAAINKATKFLQIMLTWSQIDIVMKAKQGIATTGLTLKQIFYNAQLRKTIIYMAAITGGVSLLVAGIGAAIAALTTANSSMDAFSDNYDDLKASLGSNLSDTAMSTQSTTLTSSRKTVDVNIDLYAHGDTNVSDDSAVVVGKVTMEEIQKQLGGLI